jgi:DNA-binding MarR family transcriptional regulator
MGDRRVTIDWPTLTRTLRPENSPGFLLWQVTNQWQRRMRATLEPLGLTHVQFVLLAGLAWLEHKEGAVSQARLAQFCKTDAMMTSQVVRTLEKAGLIIRSSSEQDARAKALKVTEAGAERLNQAMPAMLEADAAFFRPLQGGTAEAVAIFRSLLSGQGR